MSLRSPWREGGFGFLIYRQSDEPRPHSPFTDCVRQRSVFILEARERQLFTHWSKYLGLWRGSVAPNIWLVQSAGACLPLLTSPCVEFTQMSSLFLPAGKNTLTHMPLDARPSQFEMLSLFLWITHLKPTWKLRAASGGHSSVLQLSFLMCRCLVLCSCRLCRCLCYSGV